MKISRIIAIALVLCLCMSLGAFASSGMPDTSQGGSATSRPPDNSTRAVDQLGARAALYIEYGEDGYTLSENASDAYDVEYQTPPEAPVVGGDCVLDGIRIECNAVDWDAETEVGNSGVVINARTDEETRFYFGGEADCYEAPNGERYNSVIAMTVSDEEPDGATETAPGVGFAFNGSAVEMRNVYVESNGTGRPSVHIPSTTRDKNATQLPDLVCVDSFFVNHSTRALLLMGGDVWFLNSTVLTNSWGGLSYDNTSTTMYVANSDVENIGSGGYAIYDAAGCTAYVYGSRVIGGNVAITVCRTATLTLDSLDKADEIATAPYDGEAELLAPAATADGRTELVAYEYPIRMHADMSGPDSQATAYLNNAYVSTLAEDVVFADGTTAADWYDGEEDLDAAYSAGACVLISSHSGKVVFDGCELHSRNGQLVHSLFSYDSMASGIYPVDGAEYVGDEVVFRNMSAEGDVLHDDYMRKMDLRLENAELSGKVVSTTLAGWNNYWTEAVNALPAEERLSSGEPVDAETYLKNYVYNDVYDTVWGVRMSLDADSVWNVTGDSSLYSLTVEDPASIRGEGLSIYVGCDMRSTDNFYDWTSGTKVESLEAGKTYEGVVILTGGEAAAETGVSFLVNGEEVGTFDLGAEAGGDGYRFDLGALLDALGVGLSYDEETGTAVVEDDSGLLGALTGGLGK